ncbi:unnamed protein product, partial [Mesorhabditis spiculigera]
MVASNRLSLPTSFDDESDGGENISKKSVSRKLIHCLLEVLCLIWATIILLAGSLTGVLLCETVWGKYRHTPFLADVLPLVITQLLMNRGAVIVIHSISVTCMLILTCTKHLKFEPLWIPRAALYVVLANFFLSDLISFIALIFQK